MIALATLLDQISESQWQLRKQNLKVGFCFLRLSTEGAEVAVITTISSAQSVS